MATPPNAGGDARGLVLVSVVVAQMVVPILIGVWLDGQSGWSPVGLVVGTVVGVTAGAIGLRMLYRKANRPK